MTREELSEKVDRFINDYQGKTKGYPTDSSYSGECLSIVKLYIDGVFGITAPPSGSNSAYGYWANFPNPLSTIFNKIPNTLTNTPKKGDVPIWNTSVGGGFGHIDIFISGDVNAFTGFDQNWNGRQAHLQSHDYTNIVGWLEPKLEESVIIDDNVITDKTKLEIGERDGINFGTMEFGAVKSTLFDQARDVKNLAESVKTLTDKTTDLEKSVSTLEESRGKLEEEIKTLKKSIISNEPPQTNSLSKLFFRLYKTFEK